MTAYSGKKISPTGQVLWEDVLTPKAYQGKGTPRYRLELLYDSDQDINDLLNTINDVMLEQWDCVPDDVELPYREGDPEDPREEGKTRVRFGCPARDDREKPRLVGPKGPGYPDLEPNEWWRGCLARAKYKAAAMDVGQKKIVTLYLQDVQKVADGENWGDLDFEPVETANDAGDDLAF